MVMDALLCERNDAESLVFADDNAALHGCLMLGRPVLGAASEVVRVGSHFHVAVGNNRAREMIHQRTAAAGGTPFTVVHPAACVSSHASIGEGSFIAARAVVAPVASIGAGVIVNHNAVVDHDCLVGDFTHIAPGATLAGGVRVGRRVLVGAGANVLPGIVIGDGAVIGAGAVVAADVPPEAIMVGIPARILKKD